MERNHFDLCPHPCYHRGVSCSVDVSTSTDLLMRGEINRKSVIFHKWVEVLTEYYIPYDFKSDHFIYPEI